LSYRAQIARLRRGFSVPAATSFPLTQVVGPPFGGPTIDLQVGAAAEVDRVLGNAIPNDV